MADYDLHKLNHRDFEHLVQAIGKRAIAAGLTPFGDGPDGGREATYTGRMDYPSASSSWNGYLVVQCKFRQRPSTTDHSENYEWFKKEIEKELSSYTKPQKRRKKRPMPEFLIVATNIVLTAAGKSGTKDKTFKILDDFVKKNNLKGFDVWSFDEIGRFLDAFESIRRAYGAFVLPGDALSTILDHLQLQTPNFSRLLCSFLQKELIFDRSAKLESAASSSDRPQITLAHVFVDLPASISEESASQFHHHEEKHLWILQQLLDTGACVLRPQNLEVPTSKSKEFPRAGHARSVVVGGPGQGKSTIAQYLCQLHRVSLLRKMSYRGVSDDATSIAKAIEASAKRSSRELPEVPRIPFRIALNQFATDLARDSSLSILESLRQRISLLGQTNCTLHDIKELLKSHPWLFVFDGLDEVPASSNRDEVLRQLQAFGADLASLESDVQIIATTRPQGYSREFDPSRFTHWYLVPLNPNQALSYAKLLVDVHWGDNEPLKALVIRRLEQATRIPATVRLMQTPLQVTIMTVLVERIGEPPRQRYRLFEQYYRAIYERESSREGTLSRLLSERRVDIDTIHFRVGLVLQTEGEKAGRTEARLTDQRFYELVKARLNEVGMSPAHAHSLLAQLTSGTLERLVFLVRPVAGQVAFEIRSLQEFMAAEALLRGDDVAVTARLESIAPISYWRNVFLFAAGKCFAEREHLIPTICGLCESLNQNAANPMADLTLWGSRMALDILSDGVAAQFPKYEHLLAATSLRLIERSDPEASVALAHAYKEDLRTHFEEAIVIALGHTSPIRRSGALRLLRELTERGIGWAEQMLVDKWPTALYEQKATLLPLPENVTPWLLGKMIEVTPKLEPYTCIGHRAPWVAQSRRCQPG